MIKENMMGWMLAEAMIVIMSISLLGGVCLLADLSQESRSSPISQEIIPANQPTHTNAAISFVSASVQEKVVRQRLLGIRGNMKHTVFLLDISGSILNQPTVGTYRANWGDDGDSAWGYVKNQVEAWIQGLPVESYRVIAFNEKLFHFPNDSRWATQPEDNKSVSSFLSALQPQGLTMTEMAILEASKWQPTHIVLLTDGAPSSKLQTEFDYEQAERIKELVSSKTFNIPITVVAINHYFEADFGEFLQAIAALSGGCFIGL